MTVDAKALVEGIDTIEKALYQLKRRLRALQFNCSHQWENDVCIECGLSYDEWENLL